MGEYMIFKYGKRFRFAPSFDKLTAIPPYLLTFFYHINLQQKWVGSFPPYLLIWAHLFIWNIRKQRSFLGLLFTHKYSDKHKYKYLKDCDQCLLICSLKCRSNHLQKMNIIGSISLILFLSKIKGIQIDGKMSKLSSGLYIKSGRSCGVLNTIKFLNELPKNIGQIPQCSIIDISTKQRESLIFYGSTNAESTTKGWVLAKIPTLLGYFKSSCHNVT